MRVVNFANFTINRDVVPFNGNGTVVNKSKMKKDWCESCDHSNAADDKSNLIAKT